ncbi:hypothetical protein Aperf_G00000063916 [Anoplocephala perfoliata]
MTRRGGGRQVVVGDYRRCESTSTTQRTPLSPFRRSRASTASRSPPTMSPFFVEQENTSFGDIFTAVLGSKLAKQTVPKSPQRQFDPPKLLKSKSTSSFVDKKMSTMTQAFLEPSSFVCRTREDRERQLDIRCLRIIRKLSCYPEYQEIARRFISGEDEKEDKAINIVRKTRLRPNCGVRAYLMQILRLKEPRQSLTVSQATLFSGDSTPEHSCARDSTGSPTRADIRKTSRKSTSIEHFSEVEENFATEHSGKITNGVSAGPRSAQTATTSGNLSPETLLRRLARSISTRLTYKRYLLDQIKQRLNDLSKETEVVRSVLQKVTTDALPQMCGEADVCYFHIPPTSSSPTDIQVEMKVCQVASPSALLHHHGSLPSGHGSSSDALATATMPPNLVLRFDRLLSSQTAVLELLCQLTRRLYCLDRKIAECIAKSSESNVKEGEGERQLLETDATLFPLQSRQKQLREQINEAQRLRDDFEMTKFRLLSGLQTQFFVLEDTAVGSEGTKSCENSMIVIRAHDQGYFYGVSELRA